MDMNTADVLDLVEAVRLARTGEGRAIRTKAGVAAQAIADACGMSASALTRWEAGARRPTGRPAISWVRLLRQLPPADRNMAEARNL